jgi:hypothetical protein
LLPGLLAELLALARLLPLTGLLALTRLAGAGNGGRLLPGLRLRLACRGGGGIQCL